MDHRTLSPLNGLMNPQSHYALIVSLLALVLAGCSSTPSKVDSGPIRASTFAFMEASSSPTAARSETRKAVHAAIQDSITQGLATHGVTPATASPDLLVGYLIILGDGVATLSIDDYFGGARSSLEVQEKAHRAYTKVQDPNGFEAGTLVVDILDARSFKLLRRRYVTRPLLREPAESVRREYLRDAVNETLQGLKIIH